MTHSDRQANSSNDMGYTILQHLKKERYRIGQRVISATDRIKNDDEKEWRENGLKEDDEEYVPIRFPNVFSCF